MGLGPFSCCNTFSVRWWPSNSPGAPWLHARTSERGLSIPLTPKRTCKSQSITGNAPGMNWRVKVIISASQNGPAIPERGRLMPKASAARLRLPKRHGATDGFAFGFVAHLPQVENFSHRGHVASTEVRSVMCSSSARRSSARRKVFSVRARYRSKVGVRWRPARPQRVFAAASCCSFARADGSAPGNQMPRRLERSGSSGGMEMTISARR